MSVSIGSSGEWQSLLSNTNVVVADFYADWCGPCKMIAPHFERLAKENSRPKKMAFAKINVDSQSGIAKTYGVAAMPTFKIFHGGNCIDTIKGADPTALTAAISKAAKLGDAGKPTGEVFQTPGRTLGSDKPSGSRAVGGWNLGGLLNALIVLVGLYLVSLFSFDAYGAAEGSSFNIHRPSGSKTSGGGRTGGASKEAKAPQQKPAFRTLADLGDE